MKRSTALRVLPPATDAEISSLFDLELSPAVPRPKLAVVPVPRQPLGMPCILCGRTAAEHATPIDVGGEVVRDAEGKLVYPDTSAGSELMVPVCEQLHPGGLIPYGPPDPVVRRLPERRRRAYQLPMKVAYAIAGSLGAVSKMPGASYGLEAKECLVGRQLVKIPGSVCYGCYALKNFYATYYNALKARHHRQRAINHPLWTEAMIRLLVDYVERGGERYFRWHDSGDLQSVEHMARIAAVSEAVPVIKFWLPTREYAIVATWLEEGGRIPPNLTIRLSAHWIGSRPDVEHGVLAGLPTSTVHAATDVPPVAVSSRRADTMACRAWTRKNACGKCRACWSPDVKNVSYAAH